MKKLALTMVALMATAATSFGQIHNSRSHGSTYGTGVNTHTTTVSGYTRSNGTYVNGYVRTRSNRTNHDNYSTSGNRNPYTGAAGTRARDYSSAAYNYGSGRPIQTGSRGGQYYINSRGNKTYVPKRW